MTVSHAAIPVPRRNDIDVNRHALRLIRDFASNAVTLVLQFSLSSLLFGVLTILAFSSIFLLLLIWNWASVARIIREANEGIFAETYDGDASLLFLEDAVLKQSWMMTVGLAVNIIVGDAIVWWRACIIWRHKAVYVAGPLLLLLTLGALQSYSGPMQTLYFMIGDGSFADASAALSLATNIAATSLIATKAFFHNRRMKRYLGIYGTKTRAFKVFALFIESGSIYCMILLVVLAYEFNSETSGPLIDTEYFFVYGSLVPLVAIYPTGIVFLTALNWSPLHWGLSAPEESGEAPRSPRHAGSPSGFPTLFGSTAQEYKVDTVGSDSRSAIV
uniref:Cytochrome P450 monooxygenase AKT7 ) n=1 Tax=Ganoderma boninense TaxID=34458 RepID=A0A5K1JY37_9APHY|nr:Cytochrome P450 monooxygenase AKT7 (EC (AK-toxin biosynthesis protein 7) [Ganoderma boninense]